jgi:hypothetical protein
MFPHFIFDMVRIGVIDSERVLAILKLLTDAENRGLETCVYETVMGYRDFHNCEKYVDTIIDFTKNAIDEYCERRGNYVDENIKYVFLKNVWEITSFEVMKNNKDSVHHFHLKVFRGGEYLPKKQHYLEESSVGLFLEELKSRGLDFDKTYIGKDGYFVRLKSIGIKETTDEELTRHKRNPWNRRICRDSMEIVLESDGFNENLEQTWKEKVEYFLSEHINDKNFIDEFVKKLDVLEIDMPKEKFEARALLVCRQGIDVVKDDVYLPSRDDNEMSNALVGFASKEHLEILTSTASEKRTKAIIIQRSVTRQQKIIQNEISVKQRLLEREIRKHMVDLDEVKKHLDIAVNELGKKIRQINKLIASLEIYAGINEDLIQIIEGETSKTETLNLRQRTIYLDEEMAVWENQGLVWDNITDFDKWLYDSGKWKEILPEEKCIVLCRVRRRDVSYRWIKDPFVRCMAQDEQNKTMVLVRNGENIYRIFTSHISAWKRLFPKKTELSYLMEYMTNEREMEEKENHLFSYNKNFLLIHGLLSRTDILSPIPDTVNIMKPDTYGDFVNYIYDDEEENMLGSGSETFRHFQKRVNSNLSVGSLVFLSFDSLSSHKNQTSNDYEDRFNIYWEHDYRRSSLPSSGVYKVKSNKKTEIVSNKQTVDVGEFMSSDVDMGVISNLRYYNGKVWYNIPWENGKMTKKVDVDGMRISYKQNTGVLDEFSYDNAYVNDSILKDRGNWVSFAVEQYDDFILNLDGVSLDDIERFINDKSQRNNYLHVFPILIGIRDELKKQKSNEDQFISSMSGRLSLELGIKEETVTKEVKNAVVWYKEQLPTKIKRPLPTSKNSGKAWSLVELRAKRQLKKKHNLNIDVVGAKTGNVKEVILSCMVDRLDKGLSWEELKISTKNVNKKDFLNEIKERCEKFMFETKNIKIRKWGYDTKKEIWSKTKTSNKNSSDIVWEISIVARQ